MYKRQPQTSGKGALSFLSGELADLILLDIRMPDMDGYEVCRQIKSTASLADIPVIFLTSLDDPMDETKGLEMGACDFITRPIVPAILRARIRSHIELRQAQTALEKLLARRADRLEKAEQLLTGICADIGQFQSS